MKMKKRMTTIFVGVLFLAGLSLLLYPFVSNEWNTYRQNRLLNSHSDVIAEKAAAGEISYEQEFDQAYAYNDALLPSVLPDSFAVAAERDEEKGNGGEDSADSGDGGDSAEAKAREQEAYEAYMSCLNPAGDGMMGSVENPRLMSNCRFFTPLARKCCNTLRAIWRGALCRWEGRAPTR